MSPRSDALWRQHGATVDPQRVAERLILRAVPRLAEFDPEVLRRAFAAAVEPYTEAPSAT